MSARLTRSLQRSLTDGNEPQARINHGHVGAAQLGTCDEAGGGPPTSQRMKFAHANEAASEQVRDAVRALTGRVWACRPSPAASP
ncbi:hypothetical protein [Methylobacterium sp. J-076]|uniref:hypothetical protein n=1 Tax=Methylobacterium sp. J-076 TaxID=2836655 RepID=UPI001FB910A4|nr:hypothetical protein [Methylobacterium sp. J-076]MCJ2014760.1 hypothetical protein [Methylobacterium sp. J-076]